MPLFQLSMCVLWRQREAAIRKPAPPLSVANKPVGFLHVQYSLLPTAFYKTCALSIVNWGGVARMQTDDGSCSAMAPIVQRGSVAAMVAQVEHDVNINLDGMLDLLHHNVALSVTETKDAVPNSIRTKRPQGVEVVGVENDKVVPDDVTLTTPIVERSPTDGAEEVQPPGQSTSDKSNRRPTLSTDTPADTEATPALALPVRTAFTALPSSLCKRHFSELIANGQQQVTPIPDQVSMKGPHADLSRSQSKRANTKAATQKADSQKKTKADDKKSGFSRGRKSDKNEQTLTFNMDFFFNGTDQLLATTPLLPDAASVAQVCFILHASDFLPPRQRVTLNPLTVHLRLLDGLPPLSAGFSGDGPSERDGDVHSQDGSEADVERPAAAEPTAFFASMRMPDGRDYVTKDFNYGRQVSLDHLTVVFCGLLEPELLWENVQAKPLLLEFFWRHTTPLVSNRRFNQMEMDRYIHDPKLVDIIKRSGNPFALQNPQPTKFAEVTVDLSCLTRGTRLFSLEAALSACSAEAGSAPGGDIERGTCPPPLQPLQLLQCDTRLQLAVSLAMPLDLLPRPAPAVCAYGRLVAVLSGRGLCRSGVLPLIRRLNDAASATPRSPSDVSTPRPPSDVSTPGVGGFCLRDRGVHLLYAEARADDELLQVWAALRSLQRHHCRLRYHSGMLFRERLYQHTPLFRSLESGQLRPLILTTRFYTSEKHADQARAVRALGDCFRSQWISDVLQQNLLPSETSLISLQQLLLARGRSSASQRQRDDFECQRDACRVPA